MVDVLQILPGRAVETQQPHCFILFHGFFTHWSLFWVILSLFCSPLASFGTWPAISHWRICDLHWRLPWKRVRCRPGRQGSAWHVGHVDICSPESRVWRPGSVWNWGIGTWKVGIQPRAAAVGRCPGAQGRLGVVALDWWARLTWYWNYWKLLVWYI